MSNLPKQAFDLTGQRFGMFTALNYEYTQKGKTYWKFRCDCGNEKIMSYSQAKWSTPKNCGDKSHDCDKPHYCRDNKRIYYIHQGMIQRCTNKKDRAYKYYGGRGIKVCDEWLNNFEKFYLWAISNGYSDELTIDRIDVNGNYEPSNCRWITNSEQQLNKRSNVFIEANGKKQTIKEWSDETGIAYKTIQERNRSATYKGDLFAIPDDFKRLAYYKGELKDIKTICKEMNVNYNTMCTFYTKFVKKNGQKYPTIDENTFTYYTRRVVVIDKNGNVYHFNSIKEASEKTGARRNCISMVLSGDRKHANGYSWKYDDVVLRDKYSPDTDLGVNPYQE